MAWSCNYVGPAKDVAAAFSNQQTVPQQLKDLVQSFADAADKNPPTSPGVVYGLQISSTGHFDPTNGWNSCVLNIQMVQVVVPIPKPSLAKILESEAQTKAT